MGVRNLGKKRFKTNSFKDKLLIFIAIVITILSITNLFSLYSSRALNNEYNGILNVLLNINVLSNDLKSAMTGFEKYIQNGDQKEKEVYFSSMDQSKKMLSQSILQINDEQMFYQAIGLQNLISTYEENNGVILSIVEIDNKRSFYNEMILSKKYYNFIADRLDNLKARQVILVYKQYDYTSKKFELLSWILMGSILILMIGTFLNALRFTKKTTEPILKLTDYSYQISLGQFDSENLIVKSSEEINILASTINKLKNNLREMFGEITKHTEAENKLKEKELENLRIINELRNAELKTLQSQINPHFLFNTLNSIGRMAFSEGAPHATEMIEAVSDMLRYNLRNIDKPETIEGELKNLKRYMFIQETRFAGKLKFNLIVKTKWLERKIPCLTLQPLVENSITHGLRAYDYKGKIDISVFDQDEDVIIEITDNGVGMDPEMVRAVMSDNYQPQDSSSTGIGIINVLNRLRAFFQNENCLEIVSNIGEGTTVRVKVSHF